MTLRCAVLDDYQRVSQTLADWSTLKDVEVSVFSEPLGDAAAVAKRLADYDIVCLMRERTPFPRTLFAALPKLKLLITTGMRNASIDLAAATERGVTVCGTASFGQGTAALTIALILELARKVGHENARLKAGAAWQSTVGIELEGKTLGLLGLGKLGQRTASVATALGMKLIAWSQNLTAETCAAHGVTLVTKDRLMAESDFLSIHVQLSARTRGLVGADDLSRMKPTAYLVNTSRAPIVDGAALLTALREKRIAGAALDVFDVEPLPVADPLRALDNVLLTPHLGYVTDDNYRAFYGGTVENIRAWQAGQPVRVLTP